MRLTNKSWKKKHPNDPIVTVRRQIPSKYKKKEIPVAPFLHVWGLTGGWDYIIYCRYSEWLYSYKNQSLTKIFESNEKEEK